MTTEAETLPGPAQELNLKLANGSFELQRCNNCGHIFFYPRAACPNCGATDLSWEAATGRGVVYSTTVVRRRPEQGGPLNVALIDLEEGPRLISRVEGVEAESVKIGMPVIAEIQTKEDKDPLLVFRPLQEA